VTLRRSLLVLAILLLALPAQAADPLRLGLLHTLSPAPFYTQLTREPENLRDR